MKNLIYKYIFKQIKKYDTIVITRHIGADPDALGSQLALRDSILATFPDKKVYAVGAPASKFKYLGFLDKMPEGIESKSLLIVTDTPDRKRVDGVEPEKFSNSIKIDHHPFIEKYCNYEWIDDTASSASQMIAELIFNTKLKIDKEIAEKIYIGIVADTNRFLFSYTTPKTFEIVSRLIKETDLNFTELYDALYIRNMKEVIFEGYVATHLKITENGFASLKVTEDILKKYDIDAATASNMVNSFNYIEDIYAWAIFSYDKNLGKIRGSIRSRGPIINEVAADFGGGGHKFASGIRFNSFDEVDDLIKALDKKCEEYKKEQQN